MSDVMSSSKYQKERIPYDNERADLARKMEVIQRAGRGK